MIGAPFDALFYPTPTIDAETFLLWEPCSKSHGEIIPGYASYLLALGFKVLVLMTPGHLDQGLFSRMQHPRLIHAGFSQARIRRLMREPVIAKAAGVMITTAGKLANAADGRLDLDAVFGPQRPRRLLTVDHDVQERLAAGVWEPDTITLRRISGLASQVVNPHDFGLVAPPRAPQPRRIFAMVGAVRDNRRNQHLIYDAFARLVAKGETGFELRLIGKPGAEAIPRALRPHVTQTGRVDFHALYREVEAADFLLTGFQRDNPDHAPYRTTKTSGTFQLSYGFRKPCILQRDFAEGTALDADNALLYDTDTDLEDMLRRALTMPAAEYLALSHALDAGARRLYGESLANLKELCDA